MSFEAAPERDMLLHDLAEEMTNGVLRFLWDNSDTVDSYLARDGWVGFKQGGRMSELAQRALSLPEDVVFSVEVTPVHPSKAGVMAYVAVTPQDAPEEERLPHEVLVLQALSNRDSFLMRMRGFTQKVLVPRLAHGRDVIVHEMTHLIDNQRSGSLSKMRQPRTKAEYINSPVEYNAHFMGALTELRSWWNNVTPSTRRRATKNFAAFSHKFAQTEQGAVLFESQQERWQRKRDVRLWQIYNTLKTRTKETW